MEVDKQRIAELVKKIQSGDNSAFDELYKLTSQRAYFVALEFTKNNQDAEDILQESYVKALSKINELDKPESFSSWLNQIVANKSKDLLKKNKPTLFEAEETEVFEAIPDEDTDFSPEESLDQTELQKTVMEVLDELSEEKRACVLMMYFEELSVGEIAETLEIPEGTVKTRLFSARKDLKEKFAKRGITSTFSFAPIGVVIWALRRTSDAVSKTFVGSGASASVLASIPIAGAGTVAAGVAATTAASAVGATATGAAATGMGIAAKIAALTVAQKVIAGVSVAAVVAGGTAGIATVVIDDKKDDISTTAYTEEYTTAPSFETTLAIEAIVTVETTESTEVLTDKQTETSRSTTKSSATKTKTTNKTTTETSAQTQTTKAKVTRTTVRTVLTTKESSTVTATTKPTTTKPTTTKKKPTTTEEETTTKKVTTTKETTTKKPTTTMATVTATKPTTTEATTENVPNIGHTVPTTEGTLTALVNVNVLERETENLVIELSFAVPEGTAITPSYFGPLCAEKGYDPRSGFSGSDLGKTAVGGETYYINAHL